MGEIALQLLRDRVNREGIHLGPGFRESIARHARVLGIPFPEAWELAQMLAYEIVDRTFAKGQHDQADRPARDAPSKTAPRKDPPITGNLFIDMLLRKAANIVAVNDALTGGADSEPNKR